VSGSVPFVRNLSTLIIASIAVAFASACSANAAENPLISEGNVEKQIIQASVNAAFCILDPENLCLPYSLEYGEVEFEGDAKKLHCLTISLTVEPDVPKPEIDDLKDAINKELGKTFNRYEMENGRRPDLSEMFDTITAINEEILSTWIEEIYGPKFVTAEQVVACEARDRSEIVAGIKSQIDANYVRILQACFNQPVCFNISPTEDWFNRLLETLKMEIFSPIGIQFN
jgi:hypothetical protein